MPNGGGGSENLSGNLSLQLYKSNKEDRVIITTGEQRKGDNY